MRPTHILISMTLLAFATVGCDPDAGPTEKADEPGEKAPASPESSQETEEAEPQEAKTYENPSSIPGTDDELPSSTPPKSDDAPSIEMTLGAGGLSALVDAPDTEVTTIRDAFRGFDVFHEKTLGPGPQQETYYVRDDNSNLVELERTDGDIAQIWVLTPSIRGPEGVRVGTSYEEFSSKLGALSCAPGRHSSESVVLCKAAQADDSVHIVYDRSSIDPEKATPVEEQVQSLEIHALHWRK